LVSLLPFNLVVVTTRPGRAYGANALAGESIRAWKPKWNIVRAFVRDSWPLALSGVMILLYMRVDQVMIARMKDLREVGYYATAVRVSEVWTFLPVALATSAYPILVQAREQSIALYEHRIQQLYSALALMGYAFAIPICLGAPLIIELLYGKAFAPAAEMLRILAWADVFTALGVARSMHLMSEKMIGFHASTMIVGCALNIVLNLALIPRFGGDGAAVATLVSYWAAVHGACFLHPRLFRIGVMMTRTILWPIPRGMLERSRA